MVLAVVIHRPMLELQSKIAQVREGDLFVNVDFADRNDEIGDLGRHFNEMVQQLRESREEIERLHRTQMSRAEHLATLGEMAAGLAHEIRNPLAGIAGVMEIVGRDLPANSAAISVLGEVRHEVVHINKIVSELLEIARPKPPVFRPGDLGCSRRARLPLCLRSGSDQESDSGSEQRRSPPGAGVRSRTDPSGVIESIAECGAGLRRRRQCSRGVLFR